MMDPLGTIEYLEGTGLCMIGFERPLLTLLSVVMETLAIIFMRNGYVNLLFYITIEKWMPIRYIKLSTFYCSKVVST